MSVIGVYDADFMNYENVIPNLECAKICTYYHNKHDVSVLAPELMPEKYTQFFVRKEYNDGIYPKSLFSPNCVYGGRAFNPDAYKPLDPAIERTIPNMHLYDKYIERYGSKPAERAQIKRILNCAHIRLSTDGINPKKYGQLDTIMHTGRYTGIIFHDYDLGKVNGAYELIQQISNSRKYKEKNEIRPYSIGNKFPIQLNSSEELNKWLNINAMPNIFFLQFNGIMSDKTLYNLCLENKRMARQIYYRVINDGFDENHFLVYEAPKILKQVLFLRRQHIKILLIYDESLNIPDVIKKFILLMNYWLSRTWYENFCPGTQSLFQFCKDFRKEKIMTLAFRNANITVEDMREVFQYFREKNYQLFQMFYDYDCVEFINGGFQNVWRRD